MGLSSMPAPSDGVLTLILVNTAISISILKGIAQSVMCFLGIRLPSSDMDVVEGSICCEPSITDRFRSQFKPICFAAAAGQRRADCLVCLNCFQPESEVDRLPCGHLFHRTCLERWLDYHHATCPLCRTYLLPTEDNTVTTANVAWL